MPGHDIIVVVTRHPSLFLAQLASTLFARHTVPGLPQSEGGVGQVQAAFGAVPVHGFVAVQATMPLTARQPLPSSVQVIWTLFWQEAPAPAAQAAGGVGHEQFADGCCPVQGFPAGQFVVPNKLTQPSASFVHVPTTVPDMQNVPAPLPQPVGGAGH